MKQKDAAIESAWLEINNGEKADNATAAYYGWFKIGYTAAKEETCVWEIINSGFPLVGCNKTVFDDIENSIPPFCPDCGCRVEKMEVDNG